MGTIFVVVEHRKGEVREVSFEMLFKAGELCRELSHTLTAVVLGGKEEVFVDTLVQRADRVIFYPDDRLKNFNSELYKEVICHLIQEERPFLTLLGHTTCGMDLAPALSIRTGYPLAADCVDIELDNGQPRGIRQIYSGKVFSRISMKESEGYLISVRPGSFSPPDDLEAQQGELITNDLPDDLPEVRRQFVDFAESAAGDVDITKAELLVSVGRGVGEEDNIAVVKELADLMGGTIACSRPIVDKNWMPNYHQVGTSGKTVKPKIYLALGISGAFQHVAGISGAGTVIAVNKDKKAPIFRVADYGVVEDLFKIVAALKERLAQ